MRAPPTGRELNQIVDTVRELVKEEQNVAGLKCWTTDEYLLRFIRASNYNPHASFQLIKKYFRAKIDNPEAFIVQSPFEHKDMIKRKDLGLPLKDRDKSQRRVLNLKFGLIDPGKENWTLLIQAGMMILEAFSLEEDVQESGITLVLDCTGFSLRMMKWATPYKLRTLLGFFQDSIPMRFEAVHIINYPHIFNMFYSAMKPFMNEETKKRLIWHSNLSSITEHIDQSVLPTYLGGQADPEEAMDWYKLVMDKEEIFAGLKSLDPEIRKYNENECKLTERVQEDGIPKISYHRLK